MKSEEYRFYALVSRMRYITRWGLMQMCIRDRHNTGPAAREPLPEAAGANGGMTYAAQHL